MSKETGANTGVGLGVGVEVEVGVGIGMKVTTDADRVTVFITVSGSGGGAALEEGAGLGGAEEGYIRVKQSTHKKEVRKMCHEEKRLEDRTKRRKQKERIDMGA